MLSLVSTLVGRSVFGLRTTVASCTCNSPRKYSRSSDKVNDGPGSSSSSSSSSSDDDDDDDRPKARFQKKQEQRHIKKVMDVDQRAERQRQAAMPSKLLDQILSMKVIGSSRQRGDDQSGDMYDLVLAKPSGKFRKIRKKLKEEYEAERELEKSGLDKAIVTAVKDVASSVSGDPATTESELLTFLQTNARETGVEFNLGEMVTGMKIDRSPPRTKRDPISAELKKSRFQADRNVFGEPKHAISRASRQQLSMKSIRHVSRVDLFGAPPLNIFSTEMASTDGVQLDVPRLGLWERLERRELDLIILHPPANGFDEMITWTKQGKLWHFPIDNEQGMNEEANVGFHEHVFLEPLISDGFPKRGPVRHFMELVTVGLSKNHYLSVTKKREHIDWFRQYFKEKEEILEEVGALN